MDKQCQFHRSVSTRTGPISGEDMDTARSRPSSPRVAVPRAPSSRARETRAHKTRTRVPLAPHPRATSRAHRATDNPRSGDRGTSSNGSRERLPRRRRPRVATRERARTTHLAGAHGDRALRARRAVESHVARRLDGGGADGEHDDPLASRRSVRARPRRRGAWGGVNAYSGVVRAHEWKIYVFFGVRVFRVFMVCDEC